MTAVKKIILSSLSKICLCPYGQYGANDLNLQIEKGSSVWNSTVLFSLASELQGAALTMKAHQEFFTIYSFLQFLENCSKSLFSYLSWEFSEL